MKQHLWKEWKKGGSKDPYLEAKRAVRQGVYAAEKATEEERFSNIFDREDDRTEVFMIAKQMEAANLDMVSDKCVKHAKNKNHG